jgi:hypothetical protein
MAPLGPEYGFSGAWRPQKWQSMNRLRTGVDVHKHERFHADLQMDPE